jgi:Coenzyme PQQ synthesis protein D (PqqD)
MLAGMLEEPVDLDTVVALSTAISTRVDDDLILLNLSTARYHAVGGAGPAIVRWLDEPRPVRDICRRMMEQFDVTGETCERDVLAFVRDLVEQGLATTVR